MAGVPFTATVVTQGSGCAERAETDARVAGRIAEIRPYDTLLDRGAQACPDIYITVPHPATLVFATPGVATVRAVGSARREATLTVERTVVVVAR